MDCARLPLRSGGLCLVAALAIGPVTWRAAAAPAGNARDGRAVEALERFLARPGAANQYSASRRLEASGSGHAAWLDVLTELAPGTGLRYRVTAEGGSGFIRSRVLRSLLEEEQRQIARGPGVTAISTDNYELTPEGIDDEGLAVVRMRPLRKDRALVAGRMFLTPDGDLRRVEGSLAKNPSFWVKRVALVRWFRRINGVAMPVSLETTADLRLLGSSALTMSYRYSQVDDRVVDEERCARRQASPWARMARR